MCNAHTLVRGDSVSGHRLVLESFILPISGVTLVLCLLYLSLWKSGQDDLVPDFLPLYAAGQLVRVDPEHLYDQDRQLATQQSLAAIRPEGFLPFAYPPITAFLFLPLTVFSYGHAYLLWVSSSLFMLGLSIYLCARDFQLRQEGRRFLAMGTMALFPVYIALVQGQTAALILLLATLAFLALRKGREWQAGVWTGLLFLKPQWLLLPALVLVCRRAWKGLLGMLVCVLTLALLGISLVGWEGSLRVFELMAEIASGREGTAPPLHQYNLRSLVFFLQLAAPFWVAGSVLVALAVALTWLRPDTPWHLTTLVLGMILASPQSNPHDLILVLPALAALLAAYEDSIRLAHLLGLTLFGLLPLLTVMLIWPWVGQKIPVMALLLLSLFGLALHQSWQPSNEG